MDNVLAKQTIDDSASGVETTATTAFIETGTKVSQDYSTSVDRGAYRIKDQTLADFYRKPVLVSSGSFLASNARNDDLAVVDPYISITANPIWSNKVSGYRLMRGTAVIRVEINSNPFQQGFLRLWYLPDIETKNLNFHTKYLENKYQCPGVTIDLRNSAAEMRIPFISPLDWIDLKEVDYKWGQATLTVLEPLLVGTGGETEAFYSIYLSFEDMEFSTPVVPQAESGSTKKGKKFSASVVTGEHSALESKPISTALLSASKVASGLSSIPSLLPYTGPLSWALRVSSGIASAFGWSKADEGMRQTPVSNQINRYMATSDGVDQSQPLGLVSDRGVSMTDNMTIYDGDEMSFNFLKRQHGYIENLDWSVTDEAGKLLRTYYIGPTQMNYGRTLTYGSPAKTATFATGPPIYYLAPYFTTWRGSIEMTISFAKTDYHTGRLEFTWTPGVGSFVSPTLYTSAYSMREIVDLSNCSSITLTLPYLVAPDYLETSSGQYSGMLQVRVLNPLRAPTTASDRVEAVITSGGGPDFEFQVPKLNQTGPIFYPQAETGTVSDTKFVSASILDAPGEATIDYSTRDVGEHFTSIKQLLNRTNKINHVSDPAASLNLLVNPWFSSSATINTTSGVLVSPVVGGDVVSALMAMYGYFHGDARFLTNQNATVTNFASALPFPFATRYSIEGGIDLKGSADWKNPAIARAGGNSYNLSTTGTSMVMYVVPYSSRGKASRVTIQTSDAVKPADMSLPLASLNITSYSSFTGASFYRSFVDNFQLMYYIGCPPVLVGYV